MPAGSATRPVSRCSSTTSRPASSALVLAIARYHVIGPILLFGGGRLGNFVNGIINAGLLPLADIPIEVGKVLFLNNAINHGVLTPVGTAEAPRSAGGPLPARDEPGTGSRPAAGVCSAGKGLAKLSAPGAIIIHFFGGIHEVYFPYILMNPVMIVAMWAGGIAADSSSLPPRRAGGDTFTGQHLRLPRGHPPGQHFGVLLGVASGAVASFLVGSVILRLYPVRGQEDEEDSETATSAVPAACRPDRRPAHSPPPGVPPSRRAAHHHSETSQRGVGDGREGRR